MQQNLALLPPDEKQKIELDKQASYSVWRIKNGTADSSIIRQEAAAISDEELKAHYEECVAKYKRVMGL